VYFDRQHDLAERANLEKENKTLLEKEKKASEKKADDKKKDDKKPDEKPKPPADSIALDVSRARTVAASGGAL
jgi:hypothetical protein